MKMKKILFLLFLSANCFASGKVSLEPDYYLNYKKLGAKSGISIYEHLFGPLSYNGWSGVGVRPKYYSDAVFWAVSQHSLEFWVKKVAVAPGYGLFYNNSDDGLPKGIEQVVSLKLTYKIW